MSPGRVYRRQDLKGRTSAVDRNLKELLTRGEVRKLGAGLYFRPRRNAFGETPPDNRDLVRAFLKTDDFLLTSYNHFTELGLGLTQVYNEWVVYNHKRVGEFVLGGKKFRFRRVPAFPKKLSREYLVVDLLNNLKHLPDDGGAVLKNLPSCRADLDPARLEENLNAFGSPRARRLLGGGNA
jgi:hypothetical protein